MAKAQPKQDESNKVERTKKGLKIGPTIYRKRIEPPSHSDLLKYSSKEIDEIMEIPVQKGKQIVKDGNVFIPYAIDAQDCQKISKSYMKIRLDNARARHVVCAYSIPGDPAFLNNDSCDDDDHGAGKSILEAMQQSGISQKAIFVVRYCSKIKLGSERFECYVQAAKSVLEDHPYNKMAKINQKIVEKKRDLQGKRKQHQETEGTLYVAKDEKFYNSSSNAGKSTPKNRRKNLNNDVD